MALLDPPVSVVCFLGTSELAGRFCRYTKKAEPRLRFSVVACFEGCLIGFSLNVFAGAFHVFAEPFGRIAAEKGQ